MGLLLHLPLCPLHVNIMYQTSVDLFPKLYPHLWRESTTSEYIIYQMSNQINHCDMEGFISTVYKICTESCMSLLWGVSNSRPLEGFVIWISFWGTWSLQPRSHFPRPLHLYEALQSLPFSIHPWDFPPVPVTWLPHLPAHLVLIDIHSHPVSYTPYDNDDANVLI